MNESEATFESMLGEIVLIEKATHKKFCAKLINVTNDHLWFVNRRGEMSVIRKSAVEEMSVI